MLKGICPTCGGTNTKRRAGAERVCRACGTRFTAPTPLWERSIFALVFVVPGLLFGTIAVGIISAAQRNAVAQNGFRGAFGVGGTFGVVALICLTQGVRELIGRGKKSRERSEVDSSVEVVSTGEPDVVPFAPPLIPQKQAVSLVREIAEKHGAKGILRMLGHFREDHLANAAAHFAQAMQDDETPLALLDTSFLHNGKAGLLLTNRGLYSSFCGRPFCLADIKEVSYVKPNKLAVGAVNTITLIVASLYFFVRYVIPLNGLVVNGLSLEEFAQVVPVLIAAVVLLFLKHLQHQLLVNGRVVYKRRLRGDFWIELLTELADAARQMRTSIGVRQRKPELVVLETSLSLRGGEAIEVRQMVNPMWQQVEQSIRDLDRDGRPSLRIWAGEVEQAPALDILGGNGKYVLRELGDGWIYYDPSQGEEEVEVCTGLVGHRFPAFYVCTDLLRVLQIARHYFQTGTPE